MTTQTKPSKRRCNDWIDSYMQFVDNTEPPDNYKRWVAISVVAGAMQRKCYLEWGSLMFYPNMYIILVGPPGKSRKGTAMSPGRSFLEDLNIPMAAEAITREALIQTVAESAQSTIDENGRTTFHSSLTVFSPELTVFLGHQNYQLMSDLTDWFDCARKWTYRTKGSGTDEIIGMWINLIGATTPDLIRSALPIDAIGGGLTSRMIFIYEPNKGKIVPAPFLSDVEVQLRADLMQDLERIHALQGNFKVTQEFVDLWIDWYTEQETAQPFNDNRFAGYCERRPVHVMKLSMICSASRGDSLRLERQDLVRAISFLTDAEISMPQAFSGVGKEDNADTLSAIMQEVAIRQRVTYRDLMSAFFHDVNQSTFDSMIKTLEIINYISIERKGGATIGDNVIVYRGESSAAIGSAINAQLGGTKCTD